MKTRKRAKETEAAQGSVGVPHHKLHELYYSCMDNARDLLADAEFMIENRRFSTAFFLALTAYEEIGKGQICADFASDVVSRSEFESAFRDHGLKAAYNQRNVSLTKEEGWSAKLEYDRSSVQDLTRLRTAALYVGHDADYGPLLPATAVAESAAREMVAEVYETLDEIWYAVWLNQRLGSKGLFK